MQQMCRPSALPRLTSTVSPHDRANTGDIIEFVETTRSDMGQETRYRIVSGGDSQALTVEYISGNNDFVKGESEEVYVYPQNEEGVSQGLC